MQLYVLRHGKSGEGYPDEIRELTERGRNDLHNVLTRCVPKIPSLEKIQSSPLIRAQQTSEIAKQLLGLELCIENNDLLVPWASPEEFLATLDETAESVLVASHLPFVGNLIEYLTGIDIPMSTSTLAALDVEVAARGCAQLLWVESP